MYLQIRRTSIQFVLAVAAALALWGPLPAQAVTISKADNSDDLHLGSSWTGGVAPGSGDLAVWDNTVTAANTASLGADRAWSGLRITNPGGTVTIGGSHRLTLGGSGIDMSAATADLTINAEVQLGGTQTWNVDAGRSLEIAGNLSGSASPLRKSGSGTLIFSGAGSDISAPLHVGHSTVGGTVRFASGANFSNSSRLGVGIASGSSGVVTIDPGAGIISFGGNQGSNGNYVGVDGGTGTLNANGGTVNFTGMTGGAGHLFVGGNSNVSNGTVNMSGATVNVGTRMMLGAGYTRNGIGTDGWHNSHGNATLTLNSGRLNIGTADAGVTDNDKGFLYLKGPNGGGGTATVNLDGGTLSLGQFKLGSGGTAKTINLNGGTLEARTSTADFLDSAANTTVAVRSGGAIIDTNGHNITIAAALSHDTGGPAIDGGLTKNGAGTLTLSNTGSNFTGNIRVNAGTLLASAGVNQPAPTTTSIGDPSVARSVIVGSGATFAFGHNDVLGNAVASPAVRFVVQDGGTVTNNGNFFNVLGPLTLNGGQLTSAGGANSNFKSYLLRGTVTVGGSDASTISTSGTDAGVHLHSQTTFNVANATHNSAADLTVSATLLNQPSSLGSGSLLKTGAGAMALTAANTYTGGTTVSGGTLLVNNASGSGTGSGAVVVNSGGTLGGTGAIVTSNANVTINAGGRLSPGASIGTLTMSLGGGTLDLTNISTGGLVFELGPVPASDQVVLNSGTLALGTLDFDEFAFSAPTTLYVGETYTLFEALNHTGALGVTSGFFGNGTYGGVLSLDGSKVQLTINFSSVPEPGTLALAALGLVGLAWHFCRRGKR